MLENNEKLTKKINEITTTLLNVSSIEELKHTVEEIQKKWSVAEPTLTSLQKFINEATKSEKETKKVADGLYV